MHRVRVRVRVRLGLGRVRVPLDLGGGELIARHKKKNTHCPKGLVVQTQSNGSKNKNVPNSYV